jgi:hypothetical protein
MDMQTSATHPAELVQEPVYLVWLKAHCAWLHTDKAGFDKAADDERWRLYTTPAQPAPAQEHKELFGYEIWGNFYRDKEELLEAFVDKGIQWATPSGPFNGMNEEWVKANIREVYVHGVTALDKREAG